MELRPYQLAAIDAIKKEWTERQRTLLVLPTGCGKTIVFADVAKKRTTRGRVLILAHREELLDQARDKIKLSCGMDCSIEKAEKSCIDSPELITVGSVQTLMSEKRLNRFAPDYFKTIIVDEAHHALAKSYQNVLQHFPDAKVLGVTATPDRGDMKKLGEYFESLAYEYNLRDAVKEKYLAPIRVQTMPLNIDMSSVGVSCGDFKDNELGHALDPYLEDIADEMAKVCMNRHTVVFLPLVSTSQHFRDILNSKGFRAGEVNGQSKNREEVLQDFADGKLNVLCNSMLLTEGWDCPIVDCIVVLRPTKVRSLYCQMVGRGTRLHSQKDYLLILDFLWMTGKHQLVHPADIVCSKQEIAAKVTETVAADGEDIDIFEAEEKVESDARREREEALAKALAEKEAKAKRQNKKLVDPLEYALSIDADDLADYVPTFGWESEDVTDKQKNMLEKYGFDTEGLCKGAAVKLIGKIIARSDAGLTTPKQVKCLTKYGFQHVSEWSFDEASKMISRLSAVNWQIWKLYVKPEEYIPDSLKGRYIYERID
jgi:superfamily II DNA or RNA helicase